MKRKINLSSFQPGQIILGKIIKLETTGIIVDFDADQPSPDVESKSLHSCEQCDRL